MGNRLLCPAETVQGRGAEVSAKSLVTGVDW